MAIVPKVQQQVQVNALPGAARIPQMSSNAPAEAFGGGASGEVISQGLNKIAGQVEQYAAEQAKKANDSALTGLDLEASKEQTRIELAARKLEGKDAAGTAQFVNSEWEKASTKIKGMAANQNQADGISKILSARSGNLDRVAQVHTDDQLTKFDQAQSETYIQAQSDEAINNLHDPERVAQARMLQDTEIERLASRHGWSPEMLAQKKLDAGSLTNSAIVTRMLDNGDYKGASQYYENNKGAFSTKDILVVEKSLQSGKELMMGKDAWNQFQSFKLSDGNPDIRKMESAVNDMQINDGEKEKVLAYVKAKAGDARARKSEFDAAHDRSFLNSAIQARKQGVSLDAALPMARKFSADPYDQALKEDAIRNIYAPADIKTDPATKVALLDGVDDGTIDKAQIDDAYNKKLISPSDWISIRERYHNVVSEGKSPVQQRANEQLKFLAKSRFGSDADGMATFMSEVKSSAMGKSPDEMIKIATDKLKEDESTATRFWSWVPAVGGTTIPGFSGSPQYETDIEKRSNDSLIKGKIQQDLGVETVKAIELGGLRTGSKSSVAETVDSLSKELGGYENLKPGKPAYNAMRSLSRAGKVVTPESIKKVLAAYPDGNFTLPASNTISTAIGKLPRGGR